LDELPAKADTHKPDEFDAVIIGSGLGGLSCAAAFAREKAIGPSSWSNMTSRAAMPDYDLRVQQRNLASYIAQLKGLFPGERDGISGLFADAQALAREVERLSAAHGQVDADRFPVDYPTLYRCGQQTWGQMVDARLRDPKLKAIVSSQWGYYALPPSKLASFYYALPAIGYFEQGGYYPRGRSQAISNALVKIIEARGGKVLLNTRVERILASNGEAFGIQCQGGRQFRGRAVVSNASARQTLYRMLDEDPESDDGLFLQYKERMTGFNTSLSSFQVFLGLNRDLVNHLDLPDSEIFLAPGYDMDAEYESARRADVDRGGMFISLYDNLLPDYSPKGKNTVNLTVLQGFDHWQKFEEDYWAGRKDAYNAEKERMARTLIHRAEEALLPGLSKATEVMEIGTPLTNLRLPATTAAPFTAGIRRSTTPGNAAWAPPPRSGTSISPARGHARATAAAPCS
jgi:phytoene dehydrogenase-like protein